MSLRSSTPLKRTARALAFALLLCVLLQPIAPIAQAAVNVPACGFAEIRGVVTAGDNSQPLPEVTVTGYAEDGFASATTDATGAYTLTVPYYLDPGPYEVYFRTDFELPSAAYLTPPVTTTQVTSGAVTTLNAILTRGGALQGQIRASDTNLPLDGVLLTAYKKVDGEFSFGGSSDTDTEGNYVIHGLEGGEYVLRYDTVNLFSNSTTEQYETAYYGRVNYQSEGAPISVPQGITTTLNFSITRGTYITGQIHRSDDGGVVPAVSVHAYLLNEDGEGRGDFISASSGSAFGNYSVGPLTPGKYLLFAQTQRTNNEGGSQYHNTWDLIMEWYEDAPSSDGAKIVEVPVGAEPGDVVANFILSPGGSITGKVTDADTGEPIVGMGVATDPDAFRYGTNVLFGHAAAIDTDENGEYEIKGLLPGDYQLYAYPDFDSEYNTIGARYAVITATVVGTGTTPNANLAIRRGGNIEGTLSNAQGQPVSNIKVTLYSEDRSVFVRQTTSDSAGKYNFEGVTPGQYTLKFDRFDPCGCYNNEFYTAVGNEDGIVTVTPGQTTSGVNNAMACNAAPPPNAVFIPNIVFEEVEEKQ